MPITVTVADIVTYFLGGGDSNLAQGMDISVHHYYDLKPT
jgi:hypothetical protein